MNDTPEGQPVDAGTVKYLKVLVTGLTGTMIIGFIIITVLFVIRFSEMSGRPAPVALPDTITLPDGTSPTAFTRGPDWYAVVTGDNRILIYDLETGTLRQTLQVERGAE